MYFGLSGRFIIVNIGWYFDRIYNIKDCFMCMKNTIIHFRMGQLYGILEPTFKDSAKESVYYGSGSAAHCIC